VWTETVLHSFGSSPDGNQPFSPVVIGATGVLYGTTPYGGEVNAGIVFALLPPAGGAGAWTEENLHSFAYHEAGDGKKPDAPVAIGKNGALYGTTIGGGENGEGTVFELSPPSTAGRAWTESVIWSFQGSDGERPLAGLSIGANGALYGTTSGSNSPRLDYPATVFELSPPATQGGQWEEDVICAFPTGGESLIGTPVLIGKNGILYATPSGGDNTEGLILELSPPTSKGGAWTQTILYSFHGGNGDGAGQLTSVNGLLYGYYTEEVTLSEYGAFELKP
jgi:uncharacterized repeat protein (TIGR03803 family)